MTELIYLVRKRADLDRQRFDAACRRYERLLAERAGALRITAWRVQLHQSTLCETCFGLSRKLDDRQFDAQFTLNWDSLDGYSAGAGSAAGIAAMDELVSAEKAFIDLGRSQAFFLAQAPERETQSPSTGAAARHELVSHSIRNI